MVNRFIPFDKIETRSDEGGPTIEGYFAVFDSVYNLFDGATESIAKGAFTEAIRGDVRALYNHNDDVVLARTSAGTLELAEDEHGLWGRIQIDSSDTDAMNVYRRIARGSVTGCSFGFEIEQESRTIDDQGHVHWTIEKVSPLYEVSPCVFPAYEATSVQARHKEFDEITEETRKKKAEAWEERMKARLKNGTKDTNASQED